MRPSTAVQLPLPLVYHLRPKAPPLPPPGPVLSEQNLRKHPGWFNPTDGSR